MNSQELREKLARWLQKNTDFACNLEWDAFDEDAQEGFRCKADEIMSLLSEHYAKTLRAVGELYQQLLEFAEHGDYSNGNEALGMDEGRVRASEYLQRFRKVAEAFLRGEYPEMAYLAGWKDGTEAQSEIFFKAGMRAATLRLVLEGDRMVHLNRDAIGYATFEEFWNMLKAKLKELGI